MELFVSFLVLIELEKNEYLYLPMKVRKYENNIYKTIEINITSAIKT